MRLAALVDGLGPLELVRGGDVEVSGIAVDSRRVRPGDVFVALAGRTTDGRRHVADAIARGARAVFADGAVEAPGAALVRTPEPRRLMALAAARLHGDPSAALTLVGVTGTNGKTTTTWLLEGIWKAAGFRTGVIGTIAYRFGDVSRDAPYTTPEACDLQALLAEMRAAGVTHVAMEASSHALAQDRVLGLRFDAAAFTNLTRDHMDYHRDEEEYFAAKARLFLEHLPAGGKRDAVAVVNVDHDAGRRLVTKIRGRCVPVGQAGDALVRLSDVTSTLDGTRGRLTFGGETLPFTSRLVGAPHAENVGLAAATAWALGLAPAQIVAGIAATDAPPGRVERLPGPGFTVVVDYAHTPDALDRLLAALRPLTPGRLVTVFGCGGDRDRGKRPLMGAAAGRWSDVVVLTSDNPRTEDPAAILREIEPGVREAGLAPLGRIEGDQRGYLVEADRPAAIALALRAARPGDLVVVAGKGHEDYQIVGTEKHHLDDREEVRRVLASGGAA